MKKHTICMVTNWYPTKVNPFQGLFFRDQALAVSDYYNFIVVHYNVRKSVLSKRRKTKGVTDGNITEYTIDLYMPLFLHLYDLFCMIKMKYNKKTAIEGVGKYTAKAKRQYIKTIMIRSFSKSIKENIDAFYCVHAQEEAYYLMCLAEHYKKPYIIGEHAPFPWPGTLLNDINKEAIEKANAFLAISNDKIRQMMFQNIKLHNIVYIGNMIDDTKLMIRQNQNPVKTFIIMAAHSYFKNFDHFIHVVNRLVQITNIEFKVMIVGYASNKGYSKNAELLEQKINDSLFADKTIMIPSVPHDDIGSVLGQADAFIMTSIQEGQPVSALEAACCGLPIFSTKCGGVEDYVDDSMGRLFAISDVDGFASSLKEYLEGKILFDATLIRSKIIHRFGKEAFKKQFINTFNAAIDNCLESSNQ